MSNDGKRTGLWGKLTRGLFEFDAPLTANLLPLLPDAGELGPPQAARAAAAGRPHGRRRRHRDAGDRPAGRARR
jgi:hypothetical protein